MGNCLCRHCGRPFEAQKPDVAKYCSGRCRAADNRKRRGQAVAAALEEAERALRKVRRALGEG